MRVSEIKAELDLRDVSYKDCFDKESLVERLLEARATGKANPKIIEKFNKQRLEETFDPSKKVEVKDEDIARAVANDGKLPGGLSPDQFKKLSSNPEIMSFLQSTKVQDAMKLMMTGGREELENKIRDDPEMQETLKKLDSLMKGALA
jgi:phage FluMu protein gp41